MPLYGNELSLKLSPVDAGLGVLAATKSKESFVGRSAIVAAKEDGAQQKLIGLTGEGRRAARWIRSIRRRRADGDRQRYFGSAFPNPSHPVALAYVSTEAIESGAAAVGATVEVDIRGKRYNYTVVELPFYKREK